jgi:fructose 1,6-bisphosphatase
MPKKTTISLLKCDVGSLAGHHIVPKPLINIAEKSLKEDKEQGNKQLLRFQRWRRPSTTHGA